MPRHRIDSFVAFSLIVAVAGFATRTIAADPAMTDRHPVLPNRAPLEPTPFVRLPLGSVRAEGWLLRQLKLQKDGLTGSAEQLYDALVPDSGWLGGKGDNWEKSPYYVKGLVSLAYTLDDAELKQRARKWIDWALQSQRPDGSFGPISNDDWWPRMIVLYYMRDFYEATGDKRVVPFLSNYFRYQLATLPSRPLRDWGRARAGDNIDVVLWTYNLTGEPKLIELAKLLREQAYPWTSIFTNNQFYGQSEDFHPHHIVNVSQALKMPAVIWQFTHDRIDHAALIAGLANLQRQYGRIDGQLSGTEMLSGLKGTDGVELCADIERIISDGVGLSILGDATLGDSMEKVAYNSLPAHTSPRMRQITYYQLSNQVACTFGGHGFAQDYPNANVPGPYSGFPCCCYNWHAGWPKFVQQMWMATSDGGLATAAYGPNQVSATVADGVPVNITQDTDYPFDGVVKLHVQPQRSVTFPLVLRVPGWCKKPEIDVNGEPVGGVQAGTFHRLEREWKPGDTVQLRFPMEVRTSTWINNSVGLERGPLAFALKISERWERVHAYQDNFDEYQVLAQSPWNYALQIDRAAPDVRVRTNPVSEVPFETERAPVVLTVPARRLISWHTRALPGNVILGRSDHNWRQLAEVASVIEPGVAHRVRVEAKQKMLRIFVDDMNRPVIEKEDDAFAVGAVGLRTYETAASFDDVKIDGKTVDDFNRADATAVSWQAHGGAWALKDGKYAAEPARDGKALLDDQKDLRDFVLEAMVTVRAGGNAGLIFRASDVDAGLDGYRGYYVGLAARDGKSQDADEPPPSPVASDEPIETVELIPFGSAKLRISYFPQLGTK